MDEQTYTLRLWTDRDGIKWACAAYDHGPMCRRCVNITEAPTFAAVVDILTGKD